MRVSHVFCILIILYLGELSMAHAEEGSAWERQLDAVTFPAADVIAGNKLCGRPAQVKKIYTETQTYYSLHPAIEQDPRNLMLSNRTLDKAIGMEERVQGVGGVTKEDCANVERDTSRFLKEIDKKIQELVMQHNR